MKDSFEAILGDGSYVGKYLIPEVELNSCQKKLDFACLLAIGTTPIQVESKKLDGLDKSTTLREVRPIGTASYTISPGSISRGSIDLITQSSPDAILVNEAIVLFNGQSISEVLEGQVLASVKFEGEIIFDAIELDGFLAAVKVNSSIISEVEEGSVSASVMFNLQLVSTISEG